MKEDKIIDHKNVIGANVRRLRKQKRVGQTELVKQLQLANIAITRETLVKIESGRQHIKLSQLNGIKRILEVEYDGLLTDESNQ